MRPLRPEIIESLKEINFAERYKKLSEDFNKKEIPLKERLKNNIDGDIVKEILYKFGEKVTYNKKEKFFKLRVSKVKNYTFNNNIDLNLRRVEFIWQIKDNKEYILGHHHLTLVEEVLGEKGILIKDPLFETYEELEEILRINFEMFDDFTKTFLSHND